MTPKDLRNLRTGRNNPYNVRLFAVIQMFLNAISERNLEKADYFAKLTEIFNAKRKIWDLTNKLSIGEYE